MYREFTKEQIQLKLWTGTDWCWETYMLASTKKEIIDYVIFLSPTLKIMKKQIRLHVPIQYPVQDIRTVKERVQIGEKVCAVSFPGNQVFAVCAFFQNTGIPYGSYFIHGIEEWKAKQRYYLGKIEKNKRSMGKQGNMFYDNQKWWKKIANFNEHYAHLVSRTIVKICIRQDIKIIVIPDYKNSSIFKREVYLSSSEYEWIGRRIIQYTKYKAFMEGILVTTVRSQYTSNRCYICRAEIKRYNEGHQPKKNYYGGILYVCPNGHQGNAALNTAKNLGQYFFKKFANRENK